MKLSSKLTLAMGIVILLLGGAGVFGLIQLNSFNKEIREIVDGWMPRSIQAEGLTATSTNFRLHQVQTVTATTARGKREYETLMQGDANTLVENAKALQASLDTEESARLYEGIKTAWYKYMETSERIATLASENRVEEAMSILENQGQTEYRAVAAELKKMAEFQVAGANAAAENASALYERATTVVSSVLAVSVLIGILLAIWIIRNTLGQLGKDPGELQLLAKDVAGGNLEIKKDAKAVGVYAEILTMVDSLKEHIQNAERETANAREAMAKADEASKDAQAKRDNIMLAAERLEEVASIVSSASTQLAAQIEQSDRGAAEQANRVSETATAMNEMNATVVEVARNAGTAAEMSATTREKAEQGARVVSEAVNGIRQVQEVSLALKDDMSKLSENAQAISQIMAVISDIADQTNLLALNAAIEAARAGEAGRGFAVVADEVRNLAEKTMASTTDVGNAIKTIQDSVTKSMNQMDHAVTMVEQATELATSSGEALEEIVSMVDSTADQVHGIATASEEQSASSEEITRSIDQVRTISSETAQAMQEAAKAVSDLANQAQVLASLIDDMKNS